MTQFDPGPIINLGPSTHEPNLRVVAIEAAAQMRYDSVEEFIAAADRILGWLRTPEPSLSTILDEAVDEKTVQLPEGWELCSSAYLKRMAPSTCDDLPSLPSDYMGVSHYHPRVLHYTAKPGEYMHRTMLGYWTPRKPGILMPEELVRENQQIQDWRKSREAGNPQA